MKTFSHCHPLIFYFFSSRLSSMFWSEVTLSFLARKSNCLSQTADTIQRFANEPRQLVYVRIRKCAEDNVDRAGRFLHIDSQMPFQ